jgi:hypothetical protein
LAVQERDWTCSVSALRTALRLRGIDVSEREVIDRLLQVGLDLKDDRDMHEVLTAHLGIVAQRLGFGVELRVPHRLLAELASVPGDAGALTLSLTEAGQTRASAGDAPRAALYRALLDFGQIGRLVVFGPDDFRPSLRDLLEVTGRGDIAIALVTGLEYYGIEEDWWHALTLVRRPGRRLRVYDGLAPVGSALFDHWEDRLAAGARFDWSRWVGELLILHK